MNINVTSLIEIAGRQFRENTYKNLFCTAEDRFRFNPATVKAVQQMGDNIAGLSSEDLDFLLRNYVDIFVRTFYKTNPYTNFGNREKLLVKHIYILMLHDITNKLPVETIEKRHFERIRWLIKKTNPAVFELNYNPSHTAQRFLCAEYSSEFQLDLLGIGNRALVEPILDIGCGEHGRLVGYLRERHMEAYGIDCLKRNSKYFTNGNWLEFSYGRDKWGTIISHLSFSSHFLHHVLQDDDLDIVYARTYMKILESLVPGGSWLYTPSLPFIENLLSSEEYNVQRTTAAAGFFKTNITRL